jgi:hypothetical protein
VSVDHWDVMLSVDAGEISGLIVGPQDTFTIREYSNTDYLVEVDVDSFPTEELPPSVVELPRTTSRPKLNLRVTTVYIPTPRKAGTLPELQRLRVLFLYTEQARIDAEGDLTRGPGGDPDDHNIRAHIRGSVLDANVTLERSQINGRVEIAAMTLLEGFVPTGIPREDILTLQENETIRGLRDTLDADVVSIVLRNGEFGGPVPVCGWAIPQRPGCADPGQTPIVGCNPGPDFAPWAYHFTSVSCRASLAFPHELGHTLSAEHTRLPSATSSTACSER